MNSKNKERHRDENWCDKEREILLGLIKDCAHIIEDKNTDTNTNKKKALAWADLTEKFNMVTGKERTLPKIKEQWRRLKFLARKRMFTEKPHNKTATISTARLHEMDLMIKDIVPQNFFHNASSYEDDDGIQDNQYSHRLSPQSNPATQVVQAQVQYDRDDAQPEYQWQGEVSNNSNLQTTDDNPSGVFPVPLTELRSQRDISQGEETPTRYPVSSGESRRYMQSEESASRVYPMPLAEPMFRKFMQNAEVDKPPPNQMSDNGTLRMRRVKRKYNETEYHKTLIKIKEVEHKQKVENENILNNLRIEILQNQKEHERIKHDLETEILRIRLEKEKEELRHLQAKHS